MKRSIYYIILTGIVIGLTFSGCKSSQKVGTVAIGKAKGKGEFFDSMMEQAFQYNTLSARLNVDLKIPGKEVSSRVDLKMIKDSAFQLSVQPFLGIEMLRIEVSKDSLKVVDRINKRYVSENYEKIRGQTPVDFNFYNLQALFTNRIFVPGEQNVSRNQYNRFQLKQEGSVAEIRIEDVMHIVYTFIADGEEKLLSTRAADESGRYTLDWNYSDFRIVEGQPFPQLMDVQLSNKGVSMGGMTISFSRVQTNTPLNFDFPIPSKYNRVTFAEITKSLSNSK